MVDARPYAVHEAGHAVVACALGRPVYRVWINPEERYGEAWSGPEDDPPSDSDRTLCWAGIAATEILNAQPASGTLIWGDRRHFFNDLTPGMSWAERNRLAERASTRAQELLSANIEMLRAVADALERHRSLDRTAFYGIANQHGFPA